MITVSIVSHRHGVMVRRVVEQLLHCPEVSQVLITLNLPEDLRLPDDPRIEIVENAQPKGFAANHNAAFSLSRGVYFCPLNPDIELRGNPFSELLPLFSDECVGMVAPRVDAPNGMQEDSWRHFPTLSSLFCKVLGRGDGRYVTPKDAYPFSPEWVAGMFMLFRASVFQSLSGFDERFFLYYEDVDICVRLWKCAYRIVVSPRVAVVHAAQRDSHRKWRHLRWHLGSMARYLFKHWGRLPRSNRSI